MRQFSEFQITDGLRVRGSNWRVSTTQEGLSTKTATHPEMGMVEHPPETCLCGLVGREVDSSEDTENFTSHH